MDELYDVVSNAKKLERLRVMREILEMVDLALHDDLTLSGFRMRLESATKDFARKAVR